LVAAKLKVRDADKKSGERALFMQITIRSLAERKSNLCHRLVKNMSPATITKVTDSHSAFANRPADA
jgi:hypothetical protein